MMFEKFREQNVKNDPVNESFIESNETKMTQFLEKFEQIEVKFSIFRELLMKVK